MRGLFYSILGAVLAVIVFFWAQTSGALLGQGGTNTIIALGRLWGLFAVCGVLLQITLIGRARAFEQAFGFDRLTRIHHATGTATISLILTHPLLLIMGYSAANRFSLTGQFLNFFNGWNYVSFAVIGYVLFALIVVFASIIIRKKLAYETWYFSHLGIYAALAFAFGHELKVGTDLQNPTFALFWYALYAVVFGQLLFFRFFRPVWNFGRYSFRVARVERETPSTVSIYIEGRRLARFRIRAGQFMIFRFLAPSLWWQAHPFSLSFAPRADALRITVKAVGNFTSVLRNIRPGAPVVIDGPYGIFGKDVIQHDKLLFVAGGIGITPIRSLLETALEKGKDAVLMYANRSPADVPLQGELLDLERRHAFNFYEIMSQDPSWSGEKGRVDLQKIERLVPDFREREIYICGPAPMMAGIEKILLVSGVPQKRIHYERFSL